jgi:predicted transcriptional regulator
LSQEVWLSVDAKEYARMYVDEGRFRYEIAREMGMTAETLRRYVESAPNFAAYGQGVERCLS